MGKGRELTSRITAIAFTDSVHDAMQLDLNGHKWLQAHAINYVRSSLPLGSKVPGKNYSGCPELSAGKKTKVFFGFFCELFFYLYIFTHFVMNHT